MTFEYCERDQKHLDGTLLFHSITHDWKKEELLVATNKTSEFTDMRVALHWHYSALSQMQTLPC